MKIINFIFISFLFLFSFSLIVTANDYLSIGQNSWTQGSGNWNALGTDVITADRTFSKLLSDPLFYPLMADLDNDTVNEIIYIDDSELFIVSFNTATLQWDEEFVYNFFTSNDMGNLIIHDIDNDGYLDIMFHEGTDINFIWYNGTSWDTAQSSFTSNFDRVIITCHTDGCFITGDYSPSSEGIGVQAFNKTAQGSQIQLHTPFEQAVPPLISDFLCIDIVGISTCLISGIVDKVSTTDLYVWKVKQSSLTMTELFEYKRSGLDRSNSRFSDQNNIRLSITSPVYVQMTGNPGLEIAIGYMTDEDEFRIDLLDAELNLIDKYPFVFLADGVIVSNLMVNNFIDDTGSNDVCLLGYQTDSEELNLLCASNDHFPNAVEHIFDATGFQHYSNYDFLSGFYPMTHATEQKGSNDIIEIVTGYGIFELDTGLLSVPGDLDLIFQIPILNATVSMLDVKQEGFTDMVVMTQNNLILYDDGYSHSPPTFLDSPSINPCFDGILKLNTTLRVGYQSTDIDNDVVCHRSYVYYGLPHQQNSSIICSDSSPIISVDFNLNHTGLNNILRIELNDTFSPDPIYVEKTFSVDLEGLSMGDCIGTIDIDGVSVVVVEGLNDFCETTSDCEEYGLICSQILNKCVELTPTNENQLDNSIDNTIRTFGEATGLGSQMMWLLLMGVVGFGIWYYGSSNTGDTLFMVAIVEIIMFVMGIFMGYIGIAVLMILILLVGIVIIAWIRSKLVHNSGGV